jgi:hypothetical protein
MRPVVSSGAPRTGDAGTGERATGARRGHRGTGERAAGGRREHSRAGAPGGVRVRRLDRAADDGYRSPLVQGLRSSVDADRLARELAFAVRRLELLGAEPPGLYAEVAGDGAIEERAWLAFLIAYLCPLDGDEPFAAITEVRTSWESGETPAFDQAEAGPRTAHEAGRGDRTAVAYRAWAKRAGSQEQAFGGEPSWSTERRFARVYERLALPGFNRGARFDLLVTLGRLGVFELRAGTLALGGSDQVTLGAKRAFGIGDPLLLERRAAALAEACGVPLEAMDLALFNWGRGERATLGLGPDVAPDPKVFAAAQEALGL